MALTTFTKIAQLTTNNAGGNSFTVPAGVTTSHLGVLSIASATANDNFTVSSPWIGRSGARPGMGSMSWGVWTSIGGLAAGQTFTVTSSNGGAIHVVATWLDTGGRDVNRVGNATTRNNSYQRALAIDPVTVSGANSEVLIVAVERLVGGGVLIEDKSRFTDDYVYHENTTGARTDTAQYIGDYLQIPGGNTGITTIVYTLASTMAAGVQLGITPPVPAANAKISTFTSTFDDQTELDAKWGYVPDKAKVENGRLAILCDPWYWGVMAIPHFDLTGSSVVVQWWPPTHHYSSIRVHDEVNVYSWDNIVSWSIDYNGLAVQNTIGGTDHWNGLGAYNPAVFGHNFRIRHITGQTLALDTSLDGTNWTQRGTAFANWDLTRTCFTLTGGNGSLPDEWVYFDNVNPVAAPPAPTVTTLWQSEISQNAVTLGWFTPNVSSSRAVLSTNSALTNPVRSDPTPASISGWTHIRMKDLQPNTLYYVGLEINGVINANGRGQFRTSQGGLVNSVVAAGSTNVTGSNSAVFTRIKTINPDFFVHMGDIHLADTDVELTWRAAFRSSLESANFKSMLSSVPMTWTPNDRDASGPGSSKTGQWATFVPSVVRELTGSEMYASPTGFQRTWSHAGVRYIQLDPYTFRDNQNDTDSAAKSMLGVTQRDWFLGLLATSPEPAIIVFSAFPNYPTPVAGQWGSYPTERAIIGAAIAALSTRQRNKIVFVSGDSGAIHADDGTNAMWGRPNLCASPLDQTPGSVAPGTWSVGNVAATAGRGYFSRLTFTPNVSTYSLNMVWDAVRDDGVSVMTFSKNFSTTVIGGWTKDPTRAGGKRGFVKHVKPAGLDPIDAGTAYTSVFTDSVDGGTPSSTTTLTLDGGTP